MPDNHSLLVGLDLGERITQLSCFDHKLFEPVPIGRELSAGGDREYEIATALVMIPSKGEWHFADSEEDGNEGVLINRILKRVREEELFTVDGYTFQSKEVLKKFLVKILSLLNEYYPDETIKRLVISIPWKHPMLIKVLREVCGELDIFQDRLVIQNHKQSYMYYAVSQPKELWLNNIGLFEFDRDGLTYSQINIDHRTTPCIIGVNQKDLSDQIDFSTIHDEEVDISYAFANLAETILHKKLVTTLYMTGEAFEYEWADEALKQLCGGRRVFRGQNIYTRGACYAAREYTEEARLKQCMFLDEDMITSTILIRTYHDAAIQDVVLAQAGTVWDEVDSSIDVIPDQELEIQLLAQNVLRHETTSHMLSLSGFADRENKMTRFTVRIRFADPETCVITLKDNGFGEFYPSSNRIWERLIKV